jgi:hypothetical protein
MKPESFLDTAWPTLVEWSQTGWRWYRRHSRQVLFALGAAFVAYVGLFVYQAKFNEEIVILTAARGTSSWRSVDRVVRTLRQVERVPGVNYTVRAETTAGAEEIRDRVRGDRRGNVIAYFQNEKDPPRDMRVLVPLDYDYLQIVCRPELIAGAAPEGSAYQFHDVLPKLQHNRVFAGPAESETRQLAESLFERYGAKLDKLLNPAISDWVQAESALKAGDIDLVFYMGPFPSDTVDNFADGKSAVLLGIDDVQEALARHEGEAYLPVALPENAYSAEEWTVARPAAAADAPAGNAANSARGKTTDKTLEKPAETTFRFCPRPLATVAARRLMVCSTAMPRGDGRLIAAAVLSALESDSPQMGDWKARPHGVTAFPEEYRLIEPHPGAIRSRDQKPPSEFWNPMSWSPGQFSAVAGFILFILGKLIESLKTSAESASQRDRRGAAGAAADESLFALLRREYEDSIHALERRGSPFSRADWEAQRAALRTAHEQIGTYLAAGRLSESAAELLFAAVRNLRIELDLLEPAAVAPSVLERDQGGR